MNKDQRKLGRRLVATVTALMEAAHEAVIAGQPEALTARANAEAARRFEVVARDIAALAESTTVIAGPVKDGARAGPKSPY